MTHLRPWEHPLRVYCAGPLFNAAERAEMLALAEALRHEGFDPFVPHADGLEFAAVEPYLLAAGHAAAAVGRVLHQAIFALDTYQVVQGCGSLVCNLNGRVPDEGAVAEATMAFMLGKPVVAFKEDVRSLIVGRDNPLVAGQFEFQSVREVEEVPLALRREIEWAAAQGQRDMPCPPRLVPVLAGGRALWEELLALGPSRPDRRVAEAIWRLFAPLAERPSPGGGALQGAGA